MTTCGCTPVSFRAAGGSYAVFRLLGYAALALLIPPLLGRLGVTRFARLRVQRLFDRLLQFLQGLLQVFATLAGQGR